MKKKKPRASERLQQEKEHFADFHIRHFESNFPEAISWVVFSFAKEVRNVGLGNSSPRLDEMDQLFDQFREDESKLPKHAPFDIIVTDSKDHLRECLMNLYDDHEFSTARLCCMSDRDENALVAYEYFWIE